MNSRPIVILNCAARSEKAAALRAQLDKLAGREQIVLTQGPGSAQRQAMEAAQGGARTVVAAGGDGTINEVLNGLVGSNVTFGILPIGTINVLARELGIPLSVDGAWKVIEENRPLPIDLVRADYMRDGRRQQRHFIQVAGIGRDAHVVQKVTREAKKRWGPASYLLQLFKSMKEDLPPLMVRVDGGRELTARLVLAGNGRYYGGSIAIFPKASMTDGLLDLCLFESDRLFNAVRYLQSVVAKTQGSFPGLTYVQTRRAEITAATEMPIQLDGEFAGFLPAILEIVPAAISILVPHDESC